MNWISVLFDGFNSLALMGVKLFSSESQGGQGDWPFKQANFLSFKFEFFNVIMSDHLL